MSISMTAVLSAAGWFISNVFNLLCLSCYVSHLLLFGLEFHFCTQSYEQGLKTQFNGHTCMLDAPASCILAEMNFAPHSSCHFHCIQWWFVNNLNLNCNGSELSIGIMCFEISDILDHRFIKLCLSVWMSIGNLENA